MHEVLAGIYLVLAHDGVVQAYPATEGFTDEMTTSLDEAHVAHYAYAMFSVAMETATDWFMQSKSDMRSYSPRPLLQPLKDTPFASEAAPEPPSSAIGLKLERIHSVLLKRHDPVL
mgnify:FL=1